MPRPRADGCTQISSISAEAPPPAEMRTVVVATADSPARVKKPRPGSSRIASTFWRRWRTSRPSWLKNALRSRVIDLGVVGGREPWRGGHPATPQ